jgi:hypothetical protein
MKGTAALLEHDMVDDHKQATHPPDDLVVAASEAELLARKAVSAVPDEIIALGGNEAQAAAVADAMRLVILGDLTKARQALERGKYPPYAVDALLKGISQGLRSAAA